MPALTEPAGERELRHTLTIPIEGVEWRESGAGPDQMTVRGHAALFDLAYDMGPFRERVARGAFDTVLATDPDVHLLWEHDRRAALARTRAKNLEIRADPMGLHFWGRVVDTSFSRDLRALMEAHVVDQASWAFTVADETWDEDAQGLMRTITNVGQLFDVTITAQGANPMTDATVARSILAAAESSGRLPFLAGAATRIAPDDPAGGKTIAPDDPAVGDLARQHARQSRKRRLALIQMKR
jgi:hypothetical protein